MSDDLPKNLNSDDVDPTLDVLKFYNELVNFHDHCSFMLEALTSMLFNNTQLDHTNMPGLYSLSSNTRRKANELREEFIRLHGTSCLTKVISKNMH